MKGQVWRNRRKDSFLLASRKRREEGKEKEGFTARFLKFHEKTFSCGDLELRKENRNTIFTGGKKFNLDAVSFLSSFMFHPVCSMHSIRLSKSPKISKHGRISTVHWNKELTQQRKSRGHFTVIERQIRWQSKLLGWPRYLSSHKLAREDF